MGRNGCETRFIMHQSLMSHIAATVIPRYGSGMAYKPTMAVIAAATFT